MRHFAGDSAESYTVGVVDVARWEQFGLGDTLPFQAMWYSVPPASSSPTDRHPEVELSVVVDGIASVEVGGRVTDVPQGDCFLLDSGEAHVIHNRSVDAPLRVFTTFWMPRESGALIQPAASAVPTQPAEPTQPIELAVPTQPTEPTQRAAPTQPAERAVPTQPAEPAAGGSR